MPWWAWVALGIVTGGIVVMVGIAVWLIRHDPTRS